MYETPENKASCPVEALKMYKSYFVIVTDIVTTLGEFMKALSKKLELSKIYTNHCIRQTVVTVLRENSVSTSDIMLITGHKNPQSVERYDRKRRDKDFRNFSNTMGKCISSTSKTEVNEVKTISVKLVIIPLSAFRKLII